jgi:hypothetical protein
MVRLKWKLGLLAVAFSDTVFLNTPRLDSERPGPDSIGVRPGRSGSPRRGPNLPRKGDRAA